MSWTSLAAYGEIADDLTERRQEVLEALCMHAKATLQNPTSMELASWMKTDRSNVSNRLSELEKGYHAIHQGPARTCDVTGRLATTWILGPAPGLGLIRLKPAPKVNAKKMLVTQLRSNKDLLRRIVKQLEPEGIFVSEMLAEIRLEVEEINRALELTNGKANAAGSTSNR